MCKAGCLFYDFHRDEVIVSFFSLNCLQRIVIQTFFHLNMFLSTHCKDILFVIFFNKEKRFPLTRFLVVLFKCLMQYAKWCDTKFTVTRRC